MKNKIKKHIRKYIAVACSLLLIPIFSISSFAYTSYDFVPLTTSASFVFVNSSGGVIQAGPCDYSSVNNLYTLRNNAVSNLKGIDIDCNDYFNISVDVSNFDYYLVASIYGSASDISNFTFMCTDFNANANDHNNKSVGLIYSDSKTYYHFDTEDIKGFSISGKLNFSLYSNISGLAFYTNVLGTVPANLKFEAAILSVPKDTSSDNVQSIITAINSQTSSLGGKLDGIDSGIDKGNDLIENGNSDTQSALSDFNEVFEDFNNELDTWEQFDDDIIGEFNAANDNYKTELNNFSLSGSLLNAGTWLSTSMQTVYDNSSDYKMLWLVPLLFGIPILLFIVRKSGDDE